MRITLTSNRLFPLSRYSAFIHVAIIAESSSPASPYDNIGATLTEVIEKFYDKIKKSNGRSYITELVHDSYDSFHAQTSSKVLTGVHILKKKEILGESTRQATLEAQAWLDAGAPVK